MSEGAEASRAGPAAVPDPRGDWLWVLAVALTSRLWVFALAWLSNRGFELGREPQLLLCSWDCAWYGGVAEQGYQRVPVGHPEGDAANWAFFPLFPLLVRALAAATGAGLPVAALVLNHLAFVVALWLLYEHVRTTADAAVARFAVTALAFSPFALYFSVPYTEALYLLLMIAAMHAAHRGQWLLAGLCAAMLSATRNLGVAIVAPLVLVGIAQFGWRRLLRVAEGSEFFYLALALAPLGLALFMFHLHQVVGDALAFAHVQVAWGGELDNPVERIAVALWSGSAYERYCAAAALLALVAAAVLARHGRHAECLIVLIGTLVPAAVRLHSSPRYALTLYPVYIALALALRGSPRARMLALAALLPPGGFLVASWVAQKTYTI